MKIPVPHRHFHSNSALRDENSGGRQPAHEFDNSPARASWTPEPLATAVPSLQRGMRRAAPNNLVGSANKYSNLAPRGHPAHQVFLIT
jgi:hypothetical protein